MNEDLKGCLIFILMMVFIFILLYSMFMKNYIFFFTSIGGIWLVMDE